MRTTILAVALCITAGSTVSAQSAAADLAAGDREHQALHPEEALAAYERVLALEPDNYDALWKASRSALDLASGPVSSEHYRFQLFRTGERHARRSVQVRPSDAEGYFSLARALGKTSQSVGIRDKVKYATAIRENALQCVKLNARHSGCHHILGVWNAEVMRLSGFERMIARNVLGGRALGAASWAEAIRHLEQAVQLSSERIIHHLELGDVYRDRKNIPAAKRAYETAMRLTVADYNDERYKAQAAAALRALP